ncbi:MAG: hypothetical protein KJ710_04615 [Candidatus Omnitrophica bacterium]|nr:hypothetical protein [Candidatus Omnitrophota bacterium]
MNNPICIPNERLIHLFYRQLTIEKTDRLIKHFSNKYSLADILGQLKAENGEVYEYDKNEIDKFATITAHEEIANAITLAGFYFLDTNPVICFEMKRGFNKKDVESIDELLDILETDTEIDFSIKDDRKEFHFQFKSYPEKYKNWNPKRVIEYLDKSILPQSEYNNDINSNLIIVISIKPEEQSNFRESQDFDKIYKYLKHQNIHLQEINFIYNRNMEHMVWYQVHPEKGHYKIPWQNLPYQRVKFNSSYLDP